MRIENALTDYYRDRRTSTREVRNFLQRFGIKPIKAKDSQALFQKQMSLFRAARRSDLAESLNRLSTPEEAIAFAHSDPFAAKVVLGGDFERIVSACEFVARITLDAQPRILDIGGGLGQLSLWMAHLWPNAQITLIEKAPLDLARQWAKDLGLTNIEFVNAAFEDVEPESGAFDLAVLSSVFGSFLPERHPEFTRAEFLASASAANSIGKITPIAQKLAVVLKSDGTALVVDGLNETRILPLARAFENEGFNLHTSYMEPRTHVGEFVAVGFSRSERAPGDGALSASTFLSLNDKTLDVTDGAAESLRDLFQHSEPVLIRESTHAGIQHRVEIIEHQGLILFYETTTDGFRHAVLASAALAPLLIKGVSQHVDKSPQ
jgi:SAM-dependent methyltransferase